MKKWNYDIRPAETCYCYVTHHYRISIVKVPLAKVVDESGTEDLPKKTNSLTFLSPC